MVSDLKMRKIEKDEDVLLTTFADSLKLFFTLECNGYSQWRGGLLQVRGRLPLVEIILYSFVFRFDFEPETQETVYYI